MNSQLKNKLKAHELKEWIDSRDKFYVKEISEFLEADITSTYHLLGHRFKPVVIREFEREFNLDFIEYIEPKLLRINKRFQQLKIIVTFN